MCGLKKISDALVKLEKVIRESGITYSLIAIPPKGSKNRVHLSEGGVVLCPGSESPEAFLARKQKERSEKISPNETQEKSGEKLGLHPNDE